MVPGHPSEYNVNVGCLCHIACMLFAHGRCPPDAVQVLPWCVWSQGSLTRCVPWFFLIFNLLFISLHCLLELYSTSDITYRSFHCFYSALFSHFLSPQALHSCGCEAKNC